MKYIVKDGYLPETKEFISGFLTELKDNEVCFAYVDMLSESYEIRARSKAQVDREGSSLVNKNTGAMKKHPLLAVIRSKDGLISRYLRLLRAEAEVHRKGELKKLSEKPKKEYPIEKLIELEYPEDWFKNNPGKPYPVKLVQRLMNEGHLYKNCLSDYYEWMKSKEGVQTAEG